MVTPTPYQPNINTTTNNPAPKDIELHIASNKPVHPLPPATDNNITTTGASTNEIPDVDHRPIKKEVVWGSRLWTLFFIFAATGIILHFVAAARSENHKTYNRETTCRIIDDEYIDVRWSGGSYNDDRCTGSNDGMFNIMYFS